MKKIIYLDNAATTKVAPEVVGDAPVFYRILWQSIQRI